jgi:hypothetical protein
LRIGLSLIQKIKKIKNGEREREREREGERDGEGRRGGLKGERTKH